MIASEIKDYLKNAYAYRTSSIFIPEYTWGNLRIDALIVDISKRWIRGFEIKVSRSDFVRDDKWVLYSQFCSSISIVCPAEVVKPEEIKKPFGLLWLVPSKYGNAGIGDDPTMGYRLSWKKKPMNFQRRDALAWFWTYTHVLEMELLRLDREAADLRHTMKYRERMTTNNKL